MKNNPKRNQILELRQQGKSIYEIRQITNLPRTTIYYYLKEDNFKCYKVKINENGVPLLKIQRIANNMSQADLAKKAKSSVTMIVNLEKGVPAKHHNIVYKIAQALNCEVQDLFEIV